ncbi:gibberellin regulated protein [Artemisia annua]|uniref:Gibberellin regulated protein n=1 Tax=Artemisia annua TaxID=35608 RepID=A0A2U1QNM9_ARTAN|nr:gibberellin regulated protein [Artemisia annua]
MKNIFLLGVLLSLLLATSFIPPSLANMQVFCKAKCKVRCFKSGFPDKCMKYCQLCCLDCKCVPTYSTNMLDNKRECPCYKDKKTNKGRSKCP